MSDAEVLIAEPTGGIALLTNTGPSWHRQELVATGTWPVWNPVLDIFAVSQLDLDGETPESSISLFSLDGQRLQTVYRTPLGAPAVIGDRLPHYAQWSPGGSTLSYVAHGPMGMTLHLASVTPAEGAEEGGAPIINGAPIYHAWCPDDNFIGVHSGRELSMIESEGSRTTAPVTEKGMGFRVPAFDDDAEHMYFVVPSTKGVSLMRALFQGTQATAVAEFPAGVVVMPRPGSTDVSVAVASVPETGAFERLAIVEREGTERGSIKGPFVAAFWSPQGDRVALIVSMFTGDGRHALQIREADGKLVATSEPFFPSADFQVMLSFYDQYTHSHSVWARDGRSVVVAGRRESDSVPMTLGDSVDSWAMRFSVDEPAPFELIAPANLAFFRPRQIRVI